MILKANTRGGGKQLALHLMNDHDNDHVTLHDLRGFCSSNLTGAMKEAQAVASATRCEKYIFSISLNPPETENVPISVFEDTLARIEKKLGLTGQPRAIVFHEKEGRRHCHAAYSRIDAESMKAVELPYFKLRLRDVAKEVYKEQKWRMPKGFIDHEARDPRNYTLAEYQQAKRMGRSAADVKQIISDSWAISDSRAGFKHALSEYGFILAQGDRRGFVAVSPEGEVLAITRYAGLKAKEVRARLGEPDELPSVEEAKQQTARDMQGALGRLITQAKTGFAASMTPLMKEKEALIRHHRRERQILKQGQEQRWKQEAKQRAERLQKGWRSLLHRLTGQQRKLEDQLLLEARAALKRDERQRQEHFEAQMRERRTLQDRIRGVRSDHASLLLELRRDKLRYHHAERETLTHHFAAQISITPTFLKSVGGAQLEDCTGLNKDQFEAGHASTEPAKVEPNKERLGRLRSGKRRPRTRKPRERGHDL